GEEADPSRRPPDPCCRHRGARALLRNAGQLCSGPAIPVLPDPRTMVAARPPVNRDQRSVPTAIPPGLARRVSILPADQPPRRDCTRAPRLPIRAIDGIPPGGSAAT